MEGMAIMSNSRSVVYVCGNGPDSKGVYHDAVDGWVWVKGIAVKPSINGAVKIDESQLTTIPKPTNQLTLKMADKAVMQILLRLS
jgi:hypothetical protein